MHICSTCNKSIEPPCPVAAYESKFYHPDCLTCSHCHKSLSGTQFIKEKNGNLTCEECNAKYAPRCNRCKQIFASGQSYKKISEDLFFHNECFKCCGPCHKPIGSEFYDIEDGRFLCVDCYDKYGLDFEKHSAARNDDEDDLAFRPPPPIPQSEPPVDKLADRLENNLNLNNNNNNKNVDVLPAVERDRPKQDSNSNDLNCAKCGQKLVGTYTVYNEKKYHTKCFVCVQCNQEFREKTFFKLNDQPLCRSCHSKNLVESASKCRKCAQPILDTVVTFKNAEYHEHCLVCTMCSLKLVKQSIYTDKSDRPFCVNCFTKKEGKTCAKCNSLIAPSQANLVFEGKHFHKECFTCAKCSRQINSSESFYKADDGSDGIICTKCAN